MFGLFKSDPTEKLSKKYHEKLRQAMEAQRAGDIRKYSELTEQAEALHTELESAQQAASAK